MNGPTVILILAVAVVPLFIGIVLFDKWLDDREQRHMTAEAERYARAVQRLNELHARNEYRTRLGHRDGGDR